jgi:hypothetical protein
VIAYVTLTHPLTRAWPRPLYIEHLTPPAAAMFGDDTGSLVADYLRGRLEAAHHETMPCYETLPCRGENGTIVNVEVVSHNQDQDGYHTMLKLTATEGKSGTRLFYTTAENRKDDGSSNDRISSAKSAVTSLLDQIGPYLN